MPYNTFLTLCSYHVSTCIRPLGEVKMDTLYVDIRLICKSLLSPSCLLVMLIVNVEISFALGFIVLAITAHADECWFLHLPQSCSRYMLLKG